MVKRAINQFGQPAVSGLRSVNYRFRVMTLCSCIIQQDDYHRNTNKNVYEKNIDRNYIYNQKLLCKVCPYLLRRHQKTLLKINII